MKLPEVDVVDPHPLQGPLQLLTSLLGPALAGLGGQKELARRALQPGPKAQFGIPIAGGDIDVVDAVPQEDFERSIGHLLGNAGEGRGAKDHPRALVARPAERCKFEGHGDCELTAIGPVV